MRKKNVLLLLGILIAAIFMPFSAGAAKGTTTDKHVITIYHTNDIHGAIDNDSGLNLAKVATLKKTTENALLFDVGDATSGNAYAMMSKGKDIIDVMGMAGYDMMELGNHEFDNDLDNLAKLTSSATFPMVAANVWKQGKPLTEGTYNNGMLNNGMNHVFTVDGVKIGVFGLCTTETKTSANPEYTSQVDFQDEVSTAKEQLDALEEQGAEVIICLAHMGNEKISTTSSKLAASMNGKYAGKLDAIIDGHDHAEENTVISGTAIVETGSSMSNVGKLTLEYENDKATFEEDLLNAEDCKEIVEDTVTRTKMDELRSAVNSYLKEKVGKIAHTLWGGTINGYAEPRIHETNMGDFATDILLNELRSTIQKGELSEEYASMPTIAVMNGGGIRSTIAKGEVTREQLLSVFPFANTVQYKVITPKILYEMMVHSVSLLTGQNTESGQMSGNVFGGFLQIGGFTMTYNPNKSGDRDISITLDGQTEPLSMTDETTKIILCAENYIMSGGNEYDMLASLPVLQYRGEFTNILLNYFNDKMKSEYGTFFMPITQNRIRVLGGHEGKDYIAKIYVKNSTGASTVGDTVKYWVDGEMKGEGEVDSSQLLNITLPDGPHVVSLTEEGDEVYVNNYSGNGVTAEVSDYPTLLKTVASPTPTVVPTPSVAPIPTAAPTQTPTIVPASSPTPQVVVKSKVKKPAQVKKLKIRSIYKYGRVTWKKLKGCKGYQIQWSKNKKFTKAITSRMTSKVTYKIKRSKKNNFYIKVRAYCMNGKKRIYGKWSSQKILKRLA